jgi:hypothetical protein
MMGALQTSSQDSQPWSISSFLQQSQDEANNMASIMQSAVQNEGQLYSQMAQDEGQQAAQARQDEENALINPPAQTNFTPDAQLDPVIYLADGSNIDTNSNILTKANGDQIDTTTGQPYVDPQSVIQMANGAYLDTKNAILHEANGTQLDANTGLIISTTA